MAQAREKKAVPQVRHTKIITTLMLLAALLSTYFAAVFSANRLVGEAAVIQPLSIKQNIGIALFLLVIYLLFIVYMLVHRRKVYSDVKLMGIVTALLVLMPWFQVVCNILTPHLTPVLMAAILTAELVDDRTALGVSVLLSLECGLLASCGVLVGTEQMISHVSFIMCAANITTGVAAVFATRGITTRSAMFASSAVGGGMGAIVAAALYMMKGALWGTVLSAAGFVFFSGIFAGLLVIGSLTIWENLFDIATSARLNELLNTNNPLLKQMMYEAPGTYQHCLNVAALAEGAAERIGANALLARVGATYHDVGKLRRPQYFKENQQGDNIHDTLPPTESAAIIIAHQKDGAMILAKNKLPGAVIKIAAEHHGNSMMTYFYHKASESGEVNPKNFRYPGNKPSTQEGAIVMLADCCEAAVRSLGDCTKEERDAMVHKIVWSKLLGDDNLLSEAPLTVSDISDIERSFIRTFGGLMHDRIEYPEDAKKQ